MAEGVLGMDTGTLLGLTAVGSVITVLGSLVALYLKEVLAARSFERWKARQALTAVYDRYRKPICMAAEELSGRCYTLATKPQAWRADLGFDQLRRLANTYQDRSDAVPHFFRYKLLSDAYRLCCFLGWLELYRRDLGILDAGAESKNRALDDCIRKIRSDLADGQLNRNPNWEQWHDALIFREEQRAIGHRMIVLPPATGLIDFGTFCEQVESDETGTGPGRWFFPAIGFFANVRTDLDFRRTRMRRLVVHLTALRELLQPGSVWIRHVEGSKRLDEDLRAERQALRQDGEPAAAPKAGGAGLERGEVRSAAD